MSHPDDPLGRILLLFDPHYPPGSTLVPSIRNGGEHLQWHFFNQGFMLTTHIGKILNVIRKYTSTWPVLYLNALFEIFQ